MNGTTWMLHDAGGVRGPYTARHAEGPWFCMVPDGVDVPPGSSILASGGFGGLKELMREYGPLFHQVGWASDKSLHQGLRPGLSGMVGWVPE